MIADDLKIWLDDAKQKLVASYNNKGLRASGKWERELETQIEIQQGRIIGRILGAAHTGIMTNGRKPNANQNEISVRAFVGWAGSTFLAEWVKNKGISANPYAVAYKIAREGVSVPNQHNDGKLLDDVFNTDKMNSLYDMIRLYNVNSISSDLINQFKQNGN